ncbi:MAG: response regulator [Thermodesulfobacteriota bacterium]|nr:response regulator [Thermodesulfobacteriota bacterium]
MNVLIVEDDIFNCEVLTGMLDMVIPHMTVHTAKNGREGLKILDQLSIDIIFCDISMPVMDGTEFIKHVRSKYGQKIPVICTTAHAVTGDREKLLLLGFSDYISKPIDIMEIETIIGKYTV